MEKEQEREGESIRKKDLSGVSTELRHINHCSIPDSAVQVPPSFNDLKHECAFELVCVCDRVERAE